MTGLIDEFTLQTFDNWVEATKQTQNLAAEALLALDQFLETLNAFFDMVENVSDKDIHEKTLVKWFGMCINSAGEYVHAKSHYYNAPIFDNIASK